MSPSARRLAYRKGNLVAIYMQLSYDVVAFTVRATAECSGCVAGWRRQIVAGKTGGK
jgi:hypothetical protein